MQHDTAPVFVASKSLLKVQVVAAHEQLGHLIISPVEVGFEWVKTKSCAPFWGKATNTTRR